MKHEKWITKLQRLYCKIQNIRIHSKWIVSIHGNTVQITDFILWIAPKHWSSKSFIHTYHTYFCLLIHLVHQPTSSFLAKFSSFIKRGIRFQILGCLSVTGFVLNWESLLHCCVFLAYRHLLVDSYSKVLWEIWVQNSMPPYRPLWELRFTSYKNGRTASMKKWNQTVNQLFFFLPFMAKLP